MLKLGWRKPIEKFNQALLTKQELEEPKNDDSNNDFFVSGHFHDHQHNHTAVPIPLLQQLQAMPQ